MNRLTTFQLFLIMLISRVFITLMYMPQPDESVKMTDMMVQVVIGFLLVLITAVPVYLLMRDGNPNGFLNRCTDVSKGFGKTAAFLFAVGFLYVALRTLIRFNIFSSTVIFPDSDMRFFLILLVAAALYCIVMGLDVLGRTAEIFFTLIVLSIVFVLAATAGKLDLINFTPLLYDGIAVPFKTGIFSMAATVEILYPILLKDTLDKKSTACVYPWICTVMGFLFIMVFWQAGVLGDFGDTQLFPFFSLTSLTTVGFLERMDALITASWVVGVFIKLSMTIYILSLCLTTMFKSLNKKRAMCMSAVLLCVLSLLIRESYITRFLMANISIIAVVYAVTAVVLPVILLSAERCKNGRVADERRVSDEA